MVETLTVTIGADDAADELEVPAGLIDRLAEPEDTPAEVVADLVLLSLAGRAHALVHHSHGEVDDELEAIEADVLERFEARFGVSYAEATGHAH